MVNEPRIIATKVHHRTSVRLDIVLVTLDAKQGPVKRPVFRMVEEKDGVWPATVPTDPVMAMTIVEKSEKLQNLLREHCLYPLSLDHINVGDLALRLPKRDPTGFAM